MCLDDCDGRLSRREILVGGAAAMATAACGRSETTPPTTPPAPAKPPTPVAAEEVTFASAGVSVPALLFRPASVPARAVLVADGNPGFATWLRDLCTRIADRGFAVLYVDWMSPNFPPFPEAKVEQEAWKKQLGTATRWRTAASDFGAGMRWMRDQRIGTPDPPTAIGFCGGGVVLSHHAASAAPLRTLILFYANARISTSFANPDDPLPDLLDLVPRLNVPIQAHYGLHDPTAKPDESRELERRLVAAGRKVEFHYYADAGHGFMKAGEPLTDDRTWGYVETAAIAAEKRVFERLGGR
jgi:dienelactone hydrolase